MKLIITISVFIFLVSCNEKKLKQKPFYGQAKIVAVYTKPDGSKFLDVLIREISPLISFDSVNNQEKVTVDTLWAYSTFLPLKDSTGKAIVDSLNKPKLNTVPVWIVIRKDSVNSKIQDVPLDILLKK